MIRCRARMLCLIVVEVAAASWLATASAEQPASMPIVNPAAVPASSASGELIPPPTSTYAPCEPRSCCTCCDNYCRKPQPCVPCAPLGCCDDYCAKPYPCPPCRICCFGPNDYCSKPYCLHLPCCWPAWYSCGAVDCPSRTEPIQSSRTGEE
jgi:hypothetical protein